MNGWLVLLAAAVAAGAWAGARVFGAYGQVAAEIDQARAAGDHLGVADG